MTGHITMHILIRGRVQRVGYRAWMVQTARRLGLGGWVRNRENGEVEAMAHGPAASVESLVDACKKGPTFARVTEVQSKAVPALAEIPEGFQQRPTV